MSERRVRSLTIELNDLTERDQELYDESYDLTDSPLAMKAFIHYYVMNPVEEKDFKELSKSYTTPFPKRAQRNMTERYSIELEIREIRRELMKLSRGRGLRRVR